MPKHKPTREVQPATESRATASQFLEQVRDTGAPMTLTRHDRSAAVLLDVKSCEVLLGQSALLRDMRQAEDQVAAGKSLNRTAVAKAAFAVLCTRHDEPEAALTSSA